MSRQNDRRPVPRLLALLCVLSALVGMSNVFFLMKTLDPIQQANQVADEIIGTTSMHTRPNKLADGCYHVFLDVGSNIGMHARFLLEPSLYPKAWIARKFFVAHFGPEVLRDNRDFCIFGFEPNPVHKKQHEEMRDHYCMFTLNGGGNVFPQGKRAILREMRSLTRR